MSKDTIFAEINSNPETIIKHNLEEFESLRITDVTDIPQPIPVVTINNEIICTECNLTTISGASKSGKSAFTSIIMAGAISMNGNIDGLDCLEVKPNEYKKAVIHFDTEQARHKHQSNLKSVLKRANLDACPDYFLSYNIRALEITTYQETTLKICDVANDTFGGVHLIVVDGIADYIKDVNDTLTANAIVKFFEDLAIKFNCPIITIVHTNPNSDKERGHLGSQCQRKSESVLAVKTEGDMSYIEAKLLRMAAKGDIPNLQFAYNKDKGYHVGCGIKRPSDEVKKESRMNYLKETAIKVFGGQKSYKYGDAVKEIKEETGKSDAPSKTILKEMGENNLTEKGSDGYYRLV